jgi:hypothetical protein
MNLSNPGRMAKLCSYLLSKPWRIPQYLRTSLTSRTPLDLALPWWSHDAIIAIERWMTSETTVFEYGTGGSTLFLAQRAFSVESVENEEAWLVKTRNLLEESSLTNVNLHFEPFDFSNLADFEQSSYLQKLSQPHDLIVVDGEDHYHFDQKLSARTLCFRHAQNYVQPGGVILVDDSWRYPEIRESSRCKKLVVHESTGPCRKGVTSTDMHYY